MIATEGDPFGERIAASAVLLAAAARLHCEHSKKLRKTASLRSRAAAVGRGQQRRPFGQTCTLS
jgi:hypothetical protein